MSTSLPGSIVPGQIIYLECRQTRLYAEVIQVLSARQMGWIRPLALVVADQVQPLAAPAGEHSAAPDMIWPLNQLYPALDTEVLPVLASLADKVSGSGLANEASPEQISVHRFLEQLWAEDH